MTKRPHPARRARTVTGASSLAALLGITGFLAAHHIDTGSKTATVQATSTSTSDDGDRDADDVATTTTTSTTIAAAQPATPSSVATTQSSGS
jgi:hypothetical protein